VRGNEVVLLSLKRTKFDFGCGAPSDSLAGFQGSYYQGKGRKRKGRGGRQEREREGEGKNLPRQQLFFPTSTLVVTSVASFR